MKKDEKMTLEQKKKISDSHKGIRPSEETRRKLSESHKRYLEKFPEVKNRLGELQKGKIPWNKGKHPSEEAKRKQKETLMKTLSNPEVKKRISEAQKKRFEKEEPWNKGKRPSEETIKKLQETYKRILSDPIKRKEFSEWRRKSILKQYESMDFPLQENTKPERQIKEELIKRGYIEGTDFIHQYKFMNKFMCDFCFPKQKVIVEVYGDFWHANPNKYPIGSTLHKHQIKDIGRDKSKEAYITKVDNHAWTYLVLWESDIKKDVVNCVNKIEEVLKEKE